ncbi:unnamed protein product [Trichogramma brassicae]|uniref:Alkylglycerone-phosphate synthase n=1 Tax=Trichogramma brassicae TaxID=86971 RepID=A0A6H5IHD1_9HYME|nr:unnamed protein product [Trichogramma brassicae]
MASAPIALSATSCECGSRFQCYPVSLREFFDTPFLLSSCECGSRFRRHHACWRSLGSRIRRPLVSVVLASDFIMGVLCSIYCQPFDAKRIEKAENSLSEAVKEARIMSKCHHDVVQIVKSCLDNNIVCIAFGGGTSVSGAANCPIHETRIVITPDHIYIMIPKRHMEDIKTVKSSSRPRRGLSTLSQFLYKRPARTLKCKHLVLCFTCIV